MARSSYFRCRCAVVEAFYELLQAEGYSIGQAAGRCLVEFRDDAQGDGQPALVVLSVLLARVARHDPRALARFQPELARLRTLAKKAACWQGLAVEERERLQEDLRFVLQQAD